MQTKIEEAVAQIKLWADRELQLMGDRADKRQEVEALDRAGGDALLDGAAGDHVDRLVRSQVELRQIESALTACRERRLAAVEQRHAAEIQSLRSRALEAKQQADLITSKTADHFAAIKEIERCDFAPVGQSESARLGAMAYQLETAADDLERSGIRRSGQVQVSDATSIAPLLDELLAFHGDAPNGDDAVKWADLCDPGRRFGSSTRVYNLIFEDATINYRASYVQVHALRPALPFSSSIASAIDDCDRNQGIHRASHSMQPPRKPKTVALEPQTDVPQPEAPVDDGGARKLRINQYLGYETGRWPRPEPEEAKA
ncbi:MAG TPA: hypothetical protein VML19_17800 [Verrucomicrobiae bacterium]|nr:hypothetical protein [Verrucomicrobiae bacterium]